jgi:signal transduction histidine kinase
MPRRRSLQTRLILLIIGLTLFATTVTGGLLIGRAYQALLLQGRQNLQSVAQSLATQMDAAFSRAEAAVDNLAAGPGRASDRQRQQRGIALVLDGVEMLHLAAFIDGEGHVQSMGPEENRDRLPSPRIRRAYLAELESTHQSVSGFYQAADGRLAVLFAAARGSKVRRDGAVMGMGLLSEQGLGSLEEARIGSQGFAWLVDDHGQAVLLPRLKARLGQLGGAKVLDVPEPLTETVSERSLGKLGPCVLAVRPLEGLIGAVVVAQPLGELQNPAQRMRRQLAYLLLMWAGLSGILAWGIARPLLTRLQRLAEAARAVEHGGIPAGWLEAVPRGDEVGDLAQALDHLDQGLKRRTRERLVAHRRALQAEKSLAASQRLAELGQVAAGLAHELNNPLAVIEGSAREALRYTRPKGKAWLERVSRESARCLALVRDFLQAARQPPLKRQRTDLGALAEEAFDQARHGRTQRYRLLKGPLPTKTWIDPARFKQVLLNLFGNAFDAMPEGGELRLRHSRLGSTEKLELADGGPGIAWDDREKVFQPFYTSKPRGTGLGLGLSRNIMRAHGGDLSLAKPEEGGGARFVASWSAKETK